MRDIREKEGNEGDRLWGPYLCYSQVQLNTKHLFLFIRKLYKDEIKVNKFENKISWFNNYEIQISWFDNYVNKLGSTFWPDYYL